MSLTKRPHSTEDCPAIEIEREVFGFDHTELGVAAARRWRFPDTLVDIISHHHNPQKFKETGERLRFVQTAHLAGILAETLYTEDLNLLQNKFIFMAKTVPALEVVDFVGIASQTVEETRQAAIWTGINKSSQRSSVDILGEPNKRFLEMCISYEASIEWFYRTQIDRISTVNPFLPDKFEFADEKDR